MEFSVTGGCGFCSCMVPDGLFNGVPREEKRALRRAQRAERAFRAARGYGPDTFWNRLKQHLAG